MPSSMLQFQENEKNKPGDTLSAQIMKDGWYAHTKPKQKRSLLPLDAILRAVRIYEVAKETPLSFANVLSHKTGNKCWLKREDLQPVFSFKLRGAFNLMRQMTAGQRKIGAAACSAGNHAQGVAFSGRHLGIHVKIFMPTITPTIKVDAVRRLGAEVILIGNTFDEADAACRICVAEEKRMLVHPFDDLEVMAGQGTIGLEIMKQHCDSIHAIFLPVGGGGLAAGVGSCVKAIAPDVKIIGVETYCAAGMTVSLENGQIASLPSVGTFADGTAVKTVGVNSFAICNEGVIDEMILVSTDDICAAIKDGFADVRVVLEPAGALALAGMKKYIQRTGCKNMSFVSVLSGANTDFDRLRFISTRADTSEHLMAVTISEQPGSFKRVYDVVHPRLVTEFSYRMNNGNNGEAHVLMSYRSFPDISDADDFIRVKHDLEEQGFAVIDLQSCELAKTHGRHLVGGTSPAAAKLEVLCRFEYPERPGSLKSFLEVLPVKWNVSLFHYRNHGADVGRILAGIQVPEEAHADFWQFIRQLELEKGYLCYIETKNRFYNLFLE